MVQLQNPTFTLCLLKFLKFIFQIHEHSVNQLPVGIFHFVWLPINILYDMKWCFSNLSARLTSSYDSGSSCSSFVMLWTKCEQQWLAVFLWLSNIKWYCIECSSSYVVTVRWWWKFMVQWMTVVVIVVQWIKTTEQHGTVPLFWCHDVSGTQCFQMHKHTFIELFFFASKLCALSNRSHLYRIYSDG